MSQTRQHSSTTNEDRHASNEIAPELLKLLKLLVCPLDHGELSVNVGGLTCHVCKRTYPVSSGIPNFVIEES
ncbi:MAG: Trm112 family protein [Thermomicrobiales bacterium]